MDDEIFAGPDGTALRFFEQATKNNFQSEKRGRPVFDNSLMVEVIVPGQSLSNPQFEVERTYCEEAGLGPDGGRLVERTEKYVQFQPQIEAFKAKSGQGLVEGTPLSAWGTVDAGTVANLRASGIYTVEMLASVQDVHLQNLGTGGRVLRDQAQAFINNRQFGVPSAQMAAETANLRDELVRVTAERDDLANRLSAALAEVNALRTGAPAPQPAPGGPEGSVLASDPFGSKTISQPNPFATLDSTSASPLTPTEGEANDQAKQASENGQHATPLI